MAKHKNLEIERLRGCAVILTMFAHVHQGWLTPVFQLAWAGVDLFFVISSRRAQEISAKTSINRI
jgi:peptidoglycan/LPS O-acetylase OafA/YrhL